MTTHKVGTKAKLDEFEQHCCRALAKARHKNNRNSNVTDRQIGPQSSYATDLEGIGGEFFLAKMLNVWPDMTINVRSSSRGTDDGDMVLPDGRTIDVKTTKYATGRLAVVPNKKPTGDLFALVTGEFPNYTFKGVIDQESALSDDKMGDLGHGPTYVVEQKDLFDLEVASVAPC